MRVGCCYGCTDRKVGCHGTCEKYLSAKEEIEKENAVIRRSKLIAPATGTQNFRNPRALKNHKPISSATRHKERWM